LVDDGTRVRPVRWRGQQLMRDPLLNKGVAFTREEREAFGLEGMLPDSVLGLEEQVARSYRNLAQCADPLQKYVWLGSLQDRNETLYFRLLEQHLEELLPVVYTPTVGLATRQYSQVYRRGRGLWITPTLRGRVAGALRAWAGDRSVRLIVATDNESILGIGDQGAGGMAISIGKLALYTAGAGVDPAAVLPVSLDVGTDNQALLADPVYIGWRQKRLRGPAYTELLDEFVAGIAEVFPGALVQWEDFRKDNALRVLDRYAERVPSFNDDIQGTGATALAGMLSAARIHGRALADERVVILGAGAAGLGIARQIRAALVAEGLSADAARHGIAVLDSRGLLVENGRVRDEYKRELAWSEATAAARGLQPGSDLAAVVAAFAPTVLIGTSGQPGAFGEDLVRAVAARVERPVIMPLSNPTEHSEAVPAAVLAWTGGAALMATGSPFPDVRRDGRTYRIGQGNNAFIFPGVGLGVMLAGAPAVTPGMFYAAARALAGTVTPAELDSGLLYPAVGRLREVARRVAAAVMAEAAGAGLCPAMDAGEIDTRLARGIWRAEYRAYRPA
jgi:malic enzyme